MRPLLSTRSRFAADTVDKVERLLEVLAAISEDPLLGAAFVLHGGTALNVFAEDLPRLSIDVDLMYVGQVDVVAMREERPGVDTRLRAVLTKLGYVVRSTNDEHSGQTYRLMYGDTSIKVDVSYLARVTLLEPAEVPCPICVPPVVCRVLDRRELLAGKVKALMERVASRDLYDLARVTVTTPRLLDDRLTRALIIRAISAADPFPATRDPVAALGRFASPSAELTESLMATLPSSDQPSFPDMCEQVAELLAPCATLSEDEAEYVRLLDEEATYRPDLLFARWPDVLKRAERDPVMLWKVENLRKRRQVG